MGEYGVLLATGPGDRREKDCRPAFCAIEVHKVSFGLAARYILLKDCR